MVKDNFIHVALFDLDGVVFDTEGQYTRFWGTQARIYHPEIPDLEHIIKGQTLQQIFDRYFDDVKDEQPKIVDRLNRFEQDMDFTFLPGFVDFINDLHAHGVKTAVVTSSNQMKMSAVYKVHPRFKEYFDAILTAEDFAHSKPHPDCYLKGAARFGASPVECVVFEDSFNGLKSGRAANMKVIGLTTSNSAEAISSLSDWQMSDFQGLDYQKMCALLA